MKPPRIEADQEWEQIGSRAICGDYRLSTFAFEGNDYVVILTSYGE